MERIWTFFSFPLNLFLAMIWIAGLVWLWKNKPSCALVRFLVSPAATVSSLILFLAMGIWIGLTSRTWVVRSIPFVLGFLYMQTVLFMVTLRGWRRPSGPVRWRFLLIHSGMLLALGAGFWGAPDSYELRVKSAKGTTTEVAYDKNGSLTGLGYELTLNDFKTEFSKSGQPSHYEAWVSVNGDDEAVITINHPYNVRFGEDLYLTSVSDEGCVFQIVREPWRYFALVGILMLIAGAFMLFVGGPRR